MDTVTVTVNGTPAVAVGGAVKFRIACGVAQPKSNTPKAELKLHTRQIKDIFLVGNQRDLASRPPIESFVSIFLSAQTVLAQSQTFATLKSRGEVFPSERLSRTWPHTR